MSGNRIVCLLLVVLFASVTSQQTCNCNCECGPQVVIQDGCPCEDDGIGKPTEPPPPSPTAEPDHHVLFQAFVNTHNKKYDHQQHFDYRKEIFRQNLEYIRAHNKRADDGHHTHWLDLNHLSDLTLEEMQKINGYRQDLPKPPRTMPQASLLMLSDVTSLPKTVDWVKDGYVSSVKQQGICGSCWSFSVTGAIESLHYKQTKKRYNLSQQNLIDCVTNRGEDECCGNRIDVGYQWVIDNGGIMKYFRYPYRLTDDMCGFTDIKAHSCGYRRGDSAATIRGFRDVIKYSERALLEAVATVGPVSAAIDANQPTFLLYKNGIYNDPSCSQTKLTHAVLVVGYGTENGHDYWLVKNSYGPQWGEAGYVRMSRNRGNQCGIATEALYPV